MNSPKRYQSGMSLVELMVSMVIGLFITGVVIAVFISTSRSFRDMQKSREQIENGRFAMNLLSDEIRHAGFYGQLGVLSPPTAAVDPCSWPDLTHLYYPVQLYSTSLVAKVAPALGCLPNSEVSTGSDILVVRRTSTIPLLPTDIAAANQPYLQADPTDAEIQLGGGAMAIGTTKKADGTTNATILNKAGTAAAPIQKLLIYIYYISPCSQPTCGAAGGDGIPTLKRIELESGGAVTTWSTPIPLVSGIEYMQVDLGVDTLPTTVLTATGTRGDGAPDGAFVDTLPSGSDFHEVVSMRVNLLAQTLQTVGGYSDSGRTYNLGVAGTVPGSGAYKRQMFTAEVRLNNVAGRRERLTGE